MSPSTILHVLLHYIWRKVPSKATAVGLMVFQLSQNETWCSQVLLQHRHGAVVCLFHFFFFFLKTKQLINYLRK